ncbi:N-acetylgalactosamine-4-sulfatase [Saccharobesus litoralis]|uniref:N-acetylgalactosamine-4-sulfatase n=1 Tax=Saccharobesus litoralis TaxID=2172099 RepID=A0A2S0VLC0_9ALTE|nr:arylsulfatase [Saccharobesus litoralis]AWB64996.1 N-acetylgalactosamine-4-sulfatase [Saccharobesus litoralis]
MKKQLLCLIATCFTLLGSLTCFAALAKANKPNVIVIISDDQGYGDFSLHGNPILKTPNLDKLANDGVRLTDFHVDPTCSPTRAALMTGKYATKVGVWLTFAGRNHVYKDEITMADVFKYNGYNTGIFGKWHLGDNYPFRPQDRGFDKSFIHAGGVAGEIPDFWQNDYFDDTYFDNGKPVKTQGYSTDIWFEQTKKFIKQNQDEPFFIYLATNTPHGPFNVDPKFSEPYKKQGVPETRARFYGMIETVDNNVGQLRAFLEKEQLADNTLILYLTDNGTTAGADGNNHKVPKAGFNAGMRGKKTSPFEGGHRAASFWYWPNGGLTGGKQYQNLSAHFDVLPTFIDMFNLALPTKTDFDGMSLQSVLNGQKPLAQQNRTLVVHNQARFGLPIGDGAPVKYRDYVVMHNRWRLVGKQLFNLDADPAQQNNVANDNPKLAKTLADYYENWWQQATANQRLAPTVVNPAKQPELLLTAQAWKGDKATYDQSHVIAGVANRGFWYIDVEQAGEYKVEFSRWPKESGLGFNQGYQRALDNPGLDPNFKLYNLPPRQLKVKSVSLKLDDKIKAKASVWHDKQQTTEFTIYLTKGLHTIEGVLQETNGQKLSAYYMYLSPL